MLDWLANPEGWIALGTLTALEIVLGIDNIIFISVLVGRLHEAQRTVARRLGLGLAMVARLGLLFSISWVMGLTHPWFVLFSNEISWRDLILISGGLFLLAKATHEIHYSLEGVGEKDTAVLVSSLGMALVQISLLDIVFLLDSVITAVGLVEQVSVMAIAIILAVVAMLMAAKSIGDFVDEHPTIKILALSFLILVGVILMVEGFDVHVPKGYIYFAMAFSVAVEMLNIRMRKKRAAPVKLHRTYLKIIDSVTVSTYKSVHAAPAGRSMGPDSGALSRGAYPRKPSRSQTGPGARHLGGGVVDSEHRGAVAPAPPVLSQLQDGASPGPAVV